jgi:hypothetical protein
MPLFAIRYTRSRGGQNRAYLYSNLSMKWLPISLKGATLLIMRGEATLYEPAESKKRQ